MINKFTINEIIVIIMAMIEEFESKEMFGYESEEVYFPKPINDKLEELNEEEYEEFFCNAEEIVEEVYSLKSGELNELNAIHEEISILANDILKKYIIE
ncbi:hypothetical protein [Clostridium ihumii]|uniref:hypothetical protein n=1 Tax=Clostridium ihumii TaxID=1470356 RepID=UPI000590011B|nr:hypothetical protein [Clostridium ihumii]